MPLEAWLGGPIDGVPPLLMPAAHALVQAADDAERAVASLTPAEIWARPGGAASIGFHVRHIGGVVERLFTYARGEALTAEQLSSLRTEGDPGERPVGAEELVREMRASIERALEQLRRTSEQELLARREVGRQKLPSNVLGLIFHAAEHAQRHTGQLIVTAKVVRHGEVDPSS